MPQRGPFTRSNIDWMKTGSVKATTMLDEAPDDVVRDRQDPFGAYKLNPRVTAPPAYAD
jgi:hypothetical protein